MTERSPSMADDPAAFAAFLAEQADLAPKWLPQFVRIVDHVPQTATGKISKQPLRVARWSTAAGGWTAGAQPPNERDTRAATLRNGMIRVWVRKRVDCRTRS